MLATFRRRDFALLWTAGLISVAGDSALFIALPLHAYALTGSAVATGGVFAATLIPRVLLGSVVGVFVDRWDRKWTMVGADLLQALLLLPLLAVVSADLLWLLYAVRAVSGGVGLFFGPAENALLPRLVGEERLVTANALNALNNNLGRLLGPAVGGLVYAAGGLPAVVVADAVTFLASAGLIAAIRTPARPERAAAVASGRSAWGRMVGEWREGMGLIRGNRILSTVMLSFALGFVAEGTFEVGFAPLVIDVLRGGAWGAGLLLSAQAVGGLLAGATVARAANRVDAHRFFGWGLIGMGVADGGMANAANLAPPGVAAVGVGLGFMFLAGFPWVALNAGGTGLLQAGTADALRGRVFGAREAIGAASVLVGLGVGGPLVDAVGAVPVLSAGAAMWIVGGVFALVRLRPEVAPAG